MNIQEMQKTIRVTKQNPGLSEDEIIEKLLSVTDPVVRPGLERILLRVCTLHGRSAEEVIRFDRHNSISRVRQQYCLMAVLFGYSLPETGRTIDRDHSAVHAAKSKALNFYEIEKDYRREVEALIEKFPEHKQRLYDSLNKILSD